MKIMIHPLRNPLKSRGFFFLVLFVIGQFAFDINFTEVENLRQNRLNFVDKYESTTTKYTEPSKQAIEVRRRAIKQLEKWVTTNKKVASLSG